MEMPLKKGIPIHLKHSLGRCGLFINFWGRPHTVLGCLHDNHVQFQQSRYNTCHHVQFDV